ncbi:MAG: MopE-related protein, partial [Myxococcota bacterium]
DDADADGYGDPATEVETCTPGAGQIADGTDCDDADPATHPCAEEVCDLDDDDCDGRADLGAVQAWYPDADGDGYGHMYTVVATCAPPLGYVLDHSDCRPTDAEAYPGAAERCNTADDDCDGEVDEDFDLDGDGDRSDACSGGSDCDDADATVFTGATEVCEDGADNDCDGRDANCGFDGAFDLGDAIKLRAPSANHDAGRLLEVGDLTGDGVDDLTIAVMYADGYNGGAYVIPGPITASGTLAEGYRVEGSRATYAAGRSTGVGDVDGDGVNDLAVGAPDGTAKEWIVLGPITGDTMLADAPILYEGTSASETGHGSDLADVNGDGIADAVIGAYEDATGGYAAGTVFIDYGPLAPGTYDVNADMDAALIGDSAGAYAGRYVRAGGDVDGDGIGDILACAPYASVSGPYSGAAYVVYGGVTGDYDLGSADGILLGEAPNDYAGEELTMGDVDGDGLADVVLGSYDTRSRNAGAAYVVLGPASGTRGLGDADIVLRGDDAGQYVGLGLAVADVDDDGLGELLVGGI